MRLYRSDAGWQEREKDIRADAVIVSMSPTKLSLGAVASLQSPLPFQPSKIIVPRIVIGGVILDQPAWRRNWRSAWGHLAGTEVTDAPAQGAKKMLLIRHAPACGVPPAKVPRASPLRISPGASSASEWGSTFGSSRPSVGSHDSGYHFVNNTAHIDRFQPVIFRLSTRK
jgi:hypothetical protein